MSTTQDPKKTPRLLSCVLCQRRKVKCDRKFPCAYCTKSGVQCIPAAKTPRQRRRRFPERELLDQLKKYEDLLRQNNIEFVSLHDEPLEAMKSLDVRDLDDESNVQSASASTDVASHTSTVDSENLSSFDFWKAIEQRFDDSDNDSESSPQELNAAVVMNVWDQRGVSDSLLIFGCTQTTTNLSSLHPEPTHIFRLWQIYLDNVNPLLKVVHSPTLQGRIVEAISDLDSISPVLHALMFSVYSMAIVSLVPRQCKDLFGLIKDDALSKYQFACRQALLRSGFLRCDDRDCLTALYLYMVSVTTSVDPRALSSLIAVALRIAQRMHLSSESGCAAAGILEGEMRRRLWWSLVMFDARISELANFKTPSLTTTWDTRVPLNVNDADLLSEMTVPPTVHETPTDSIFIVVHSMLVDFIRNTNVRLDYTSPNSQPPTDSPAPNPVSKESQISKIERILEETYLRHCNPSIPLHFLAIWRIRALLAKAHLMESYARFSHPTPPSPAPESDIPHALRILECDTMLLSTPLADPYRWVSHHHFPFSAYVHLVKDLRRRPFGKLADRAWEVMGANFETRIDSTFAGSELFFELFSRLVLGAWWAKQAKYKQLGEEVDAVPRIVERLRSLREQRGLMAVGLSGTGARVNYEISAGANGCTEPNSASNSMFADQEFGNVDGQFSLDVDMDQFGWPMMDWGFGQGQQYAW